MSAGVAGLARVDDFEARIRGCLLAGAVGDALGRESSSPRWARSARVSARKG